MVDERLASYVDSALKSGKDLEQVKASLVNKGWTENEVDEAIAEFQKGGKENAKKQDVKPAKENSAGGKSHKKIYMAGAAIAIAVLCVTAYYVLVVMQTPIEHLPTGFCGNGICDSGESIAACPQDCKETPVVPDIPSGPVTVSVSPASLSAANGETFTLEFMVSGASDFFGFQFDVEYDPAILQFQNVEHGAFLNNNGQDNTFCVDYKTSSGIVENIACTRLGRTAVQGSGVLEKITFKAIASGRSQIKISGLKLANSKAAEIQATVSNGEVNVS
ncbi:MAG: cohesin domain-containing protein [Candidatus Aenigmarchaeota archaeon]|nr:cohesin domain-containing protein [Candidatus Aenigmarchaeota archaeon]